MVIVDGSDDFPIFRWVADAIEPVHIFMLPLSVGSINKPFVLLAPIYVVFPDDP